MRARPTLPKWQAIPLPGRRFSSRHSESVSASWRGIVVSRGRDHNAASACPEVVFRFIKQKLSNIEHSRAVPETPNAHFLSELRLQKDRSREKTSPPSSLAVKRVMPLNHLDRESNEPTCRPKHSSASAQSEWRAAVKLLEAWALHPSR